jgi:hypothetical protein
MMSFRKKQENPDDRTADEVTVGDLNVVVGVDVGFGADDIPLR